jgi:ACR3 family arsenite efflux pump ArsB
MKNISVNTIHWHFSQVVVSMANQLMLVGLHLTIILMLNLKGDCQAFRPSIAVNFNEKSFLGGNLEHR